MTEEEYSPLDMGQLFKEMVYFDKQRTIVIDSPCNTGKTYWYQHEVLPRVKTALVVLSRYGLADSVIIKLSDGSSLTVHDYDCVKDLSSIERSKLDLSYLSVCINSIPRLLNGSERFDCIIYDEIEQVAQHCFSSAMPEQIRPLLFKTMRALNENAGMVIACQANLSRLTTRFLETLGCQNLHVVRNEYKPWKGVRANFHPSEVSLIESLYAHIEAGKPAIIACATRTQSEIIEIMLKRNFSLIRSIVIHSWNAREKEQKDLLREPNKYAEKYDVIIHSSFIRNGISIDKPTKFNKVFGFFSSDPYDDDDMWNEGNDNYSDKCCFYDDDDDYDYGQFDLGTPNDFYQMLFRSRGVTDIELFISDTQNEVKTREQILNELMAKYDIAREQIINELMAKFEITPEVELRIEAQIELAREKSYALRRLFALLAQDGCDIKFVGDPSPRPPCRGV